MHDRIVCLNDPVNLVDPSGLIVGSLLTKIAGKIVGATAEGAYLAGKVADAGVSVGIAAGALPQEVVNAIGVGAEGLQIAGGVQSISLGAIVAGASSSVALPLILAGAGGGEIGFGINSLYERISGQSLGADIYDWLHPAKEANPCK